LAQAAFRRINANIKARAESTADNATISIATSTRVSMAVHSCNQKKQKEQQSDDEVSFLFATAKYSLP